MIKSKKKKKIQKGFNFFEKAEERKH